MTDFLSLYRQVVVGKATKIVGKNDAPRTRTVALPSSELLAEFLAHLFRIFSKSGVEFGNAACDGRIQNG